MKNSAQDKRAKNLEALVQKDNLQWYTTTLLNCVSTCF